MEDGGERVVFTGDTLFISGRSFFFSFSFFPLSSWGGDGILYGRQGTLTLGRWVGCGKFFEGNAAEMHEALNRRLAALPDDTVVYVSLALTHP